LLEGFRLPGEAQQIERVVSNFAETYFNTIKHLPNREIENQDSAFVLAYSIIMLNTDQHNAQVRRSMTQEDFRRNNRKLNDGKDFDSNYLNAIYDAIKTSEIVMPEEHEGDLGFNFAWREMLKRAEAGSPYIPFPREDGYEKDMFSAVCGPILGAISYGIF
jgi:Sec7-like guanine-nucleotide exchange factor